MLVVSCYLQWLSFVPIDGKVHLSNPTHEFHLFEDYGDSANHAPDKPLKVYFGRLVSSLESLWKLFFRHNII